MPGIVEVRTFLGQSYQYELSTNLGRLVANAPKEQAFEPGTRVFARFPSERIVLC